jgi:hypothetical protein
MRRPRTLRSALAPLGATVVIASGGCLGGDDGSPDDAEQTAALDDIAGAVTETTLDATTAALQRLEEWSSGVPTARAHSWNETEEAWTLDETVEYSGENAQGVVTLHWWLQFRSGGTAQQQPDDTTDEVEVRLAATNVGTYDPGDFQVVYDWSAGHEVTRTRDPGGSKTFAGGGWLEGTTTTTLPRRTLVHSQDVSWSHEFTAAPDQPCVSGWFEGLSAPSWSFYATFDGQGGYAWELRREDTLVRSGTGEYACAPPA